MDGTFSALLGAVIGGSLSAFASWQSQCAQTKSQWLTCETQRRQQLYSNFVELAVRCYADALQISEPNIRRLAKLYAAMGQMRLHCSDAVVSEAYRVIHRVLDAHGDSNRSRGEIRDLLAGDSIDLLSDFGDACRAELTRLQPHPAGQEGLATFRLTTPADLVSAL